MNVKHAMLAGQSPRRSASTVGRLRTRRNNPKVKLLEFDSLYSFKIAPPSRGYLGYKVRDKTKYFSQIRNNGVHAYSLPRKQKQAAVDLNQAEVQFKRCFAVRVFVISINNNII